MSELAADGIGVAVACRAWKRGRPPVFRPLAEALRHAALVGGPRTDAPLEGEPNARENGTPRPAAQPANRLIAQKLPERLAPELDGAPPLGRSPRE